MSVELNKQVEVAKWIYDNSIKVRYAFRNFIIYHRLFLFKPDYTKSLSKPSNSELSTHLQRECRIIRAGNRSQCGKFRPKLAWPVMYLRIRYKFKVAITIGTPSNLGIGIRSDYINSCEVLSKDHGWVSAKSLFPREDVLQDWIDFCYDNDNPIFKRLEELNVFKAKVSDLNRLISAYVDILPDRIYS